MGMGRNKTPYLFAPSEEVPEPAGRPEAAGDTSVESGGTSLAHCISRVAWHGAPRKQHRDTALSLGSFWAICYKHCVSTWAFQF